MSYWGLRSQLWAFQGEKGMEKLGTEESGSTNMHKSGLITSSEAEGSLHALRKRIAIKENGLNTC